MQYQIRAALGGVAAVVAFILMVPHILVPWVWVVCLVAAGGFTGLALLIRTEKYVSRSPVQWIVLVTVWLFSLTVAGLFPIGLYVYGLSPDAIDLTYQLSRISLVPSMFAIIVLFIVLLLTKN